MSKTQITLPALLDAMAASGSVLADWARAEIEAAGAFLQTQMAALPAMMAVPPASPSAVLTQVQTLWVQALKAGMASVARAADVATKAGAPLVKALEPAA